MKTALVSQYSCCCCCRCCWRCVSVRSALAPALSAQSPSDQVASQLTGRTRRDKVKDMIGTFVVLSDWSQTWHRESKKVDKMSSSKSDSRIRLVDCEKRPSPSQSSSSLPSSSSPNPSTLCNVRTEWSRLSLVAAWTVCGLACLLTAWTAVLYWTQLSRLRADLDSLRREFQDASQLTADHIDSVIAQVNFVTFLPRRLMKFAGVDNGQRGLKMQ